MALETFRVEDLGMRIDQKHAVLTASLPKSGPHPGISGAHARTCV